MSNFNQSFDLLMSLEHGRPSLALHQNKGEQGLTFLGIYECANPNLLIWQTIKEIIIECDNDIKKASLACLEVYGMVEQIKAFYKKFYWDRAKLDNITNDKVALAIFIFGVNVGMRTSITKAQIAAFAIPDGIVGSQTIKALNLIDSEVFLERLKQLHIKYYDDLRSQSEHFARFYLGWINRTNSVFA